MPYARTADGKLLLVKASEENLFSLWNQCFLAFSLVLNPFSPTGNCCCRIVSHYWLTMKYLKATKATFSTYMLVDNLKNGCIFLLLFQSCMLSLNIICFPLLLAVDGCICSRKEGMYKHFFRFPPQTFCNYLIIQASRSGVGRGLAF